MAIEPKTIFPSLIADTENIVLGYMCPRASVALSGVNRYAYEKLSNGIYFKDLFAKKYPHLAKTELVYSQLKTFYPDYVWKIAWCSMRKNYIPFKAEFLERAEGPMMAGFLLQKQEFIEKKIAAEQTFKRICGSHYEDPSSSIHQAWKEWSEYRVEFEAFRLCIKEETEKLLVPFKDIIEFIADHHQFPNYVDPQKIPYERKIEIATDKLIDFLSDEERVSLFSTQAIQNCPVAQFLDLNKIDQYQKVGSALLQIREKERERMRHATFLCDNYRRLESQQRHSVSEAQLCSIEVVKIEKKLTDICQINRSLLFVDHYFARNAEKFIYDLNRLATMKNVSRDLESLPIADVFHSYRQRINACEQSGLIWELVYHRCAKKVFEEQWAEKHFHKFPQEFEEIMTRLKSLAQSFKKTYFKDLDFTLKCFAEDNFEIIKERLPFLKAFLEDPMRLLKIEASDNILNSWQIDIFREGASLPVFNLLVLKDPIRYLLVNKLSSMFPIISLLIKHVEQLEDQHIPIPPQSSLLGLN